MWTSSEKFKLEHYTGGKTKQLNRSSWVGWLVLFFPLSQHHICAKIV